MSVTEAYKTTTVNDSDFQIRLSDVVQWFVESRKTVILWALGALVVGATYAFIQPNEFTTLVRVMPEVRAQGGAGGSLGDLKSLAGLAGVNLDNTGSNIDAVRPDLYPDILTSIPFALYMLSQPVYTTETGKQMTLQEYLTWAGEQTLTGKISAFFAGLLPSDDEKAPAPGGGKSRALMLTPTQEAWTSAITARIGASLDKKSGIITISAQMPNPIVAGTVGQLTLDYLTRYVTDYRTGKARQQVLFLEQQIRNARRRYENAEVAVSNYRDRNRNLYLETAKIDEQRLQADYLLAQGVYNDLSKQLEQARIKVQEEAPVFQTLDPPRVPLKKSAPKRLIIIIAFTIFGALLGLTLFFIRKLSRQKFA